MIIIMPYYTYITYLSSQSKTNSMIAADTKQFIQLYLDQLNNKPKTPTLLRNFIKDEELIGHVLMYEHAFPGYQLLPDEIICEDDRVAVRGRIKATHRGDLMGIPPTGRPVDVPLSVIYHIDDDRIVNSWIFYDRMELMNQLGLGNSN